MDLQVRPQVPRPRGGVGREPGGVLVQPFLESADVRIAQAHHTHPVAPCHHLRRQLVDLFGQAVGVGHLGGHRLVDRCVRWMRILGVRPGQARDAPGARHRRMPDPGPARLLQDGEGREAVAREDLERGVARGSRDRRQVDDRVGALQSRPYGLRVGGVTGHDQARREITGIVEDQGVGLDPALGKQRQDRSSDPPGGPGDHRSSDHPVTLLRRASTRGLARRRRARTPPRWWLRRRPGSPMW